MSAAPRTERRVAAGLRRAIVRACVRACVLLATIGAGRAAAQMPIMLQGILDGEGWSTNATSNLLTRNHGDPAALGRLEMWGAIQPWRGLVFYAQGDAETGAARTDTAAGQVYSNLFGAQYTFTPAFVLTGGRLTPIIGTFAPRHFSTRNPLIGEPDGYSLEYPLGVEASGEYSLFDYRAGMVSLPTTHDYYEPKPTPQLRPAIGGGITPMTGLRFGGSFTIGPYLNRGIDTAQLFGKSWDEYQQRVIAADFAYSHGYLETHAEAARGTYDIPGGNAITGITYYGEAKYTLTPRFYLATRVERNDYPFIRPSTAVWAARLTDFADAEIGGGYRLGASTLLKISWRGDRWWVKPGSGFRGTGGHAIAFQFSQAFDVMGWINR